MELIWEVVPNGVKAFDSLSLSLSLSLNNVIKLWKPVRCWGGDLIAGGLGKASVFPKVIVSNFLYHYFYYF